VRSDKCGIVDKLPTYRSSSRAFILFRNGQSPCSYSLIEQDRVQTRAVRAPSDVGCVMSRASFLCERLATRNVYGVHTYLCRDLFHG
jgi:hypothetical protein